MKEEECEDKIVIKINEEEKWRKKCVGNHPKLLFQTKKEPLK